MFSLRIFFLLATVVIVVFAGSDQGSTRIVHTFSNYSKLTGVIQSSGAYIYRSDGTVNLDKAAIISFEINKIVKREVSVRAKLTFQDDVSMFTTVTIDGSIAIVDGDDNLATITTPFAMFVRRPKTNGVHFSPWYKVNSLDVLNGYNDTSDTFTMFMHANYFV